MDFRVFEASGIFSDFPMIECLEKKLFGIYAGFCMSGFDTSLPVLGDKRGSVLLQAESSVSLAWTRSWKISFKELDLFLSVSRHCGSGVLVERYD